MSRLDVGTTGTAQLEISDEVIETFAALTGDENPLHTDPDYAKNAFFGERVAHGALVASVISAALTELPGENLYLSQELEFQEPVYPGDTVTATVTVVEEVDDGRVAVETIAETDAGTVVTGMAKMLPVDA